MTRANTVSYIEHEKHPQWMPAVWAGLIAGIVFVMAEMLLIVLAGTGSAWGPPRMMAAILMGENVLPPPATFDLGIVMVGMMIHFVLSIIYAFVLGFLILRMDLKGALALGAVFGLALYLINFYVFTAAFPWFAMARGWITIVAHLIFGLVLAWSYKALVHQRAGQHVRAR
ncbi:MAG: sodium:proline symporter [Thiogranum sp.]|nr:sodium:proline symporter [Thiogranum sp.]